MDVKLFDTEAVLGIFPDKVRPSKKDLEEWVREQGCYRNVLGKIAFTDADIDELVKSFAPINAVPQDHRLRVMNDYPPEARGFIVFIADALDDCVPVFIGFAPGDETGIADLLRVVQFGYAGELNVVCAIPATRQEVDEFQAEFKTLKIRTNWFSRERALEERIVQLRDVMLGIPNDTPSDEGDDDVE